MIERHIGRDVRRRRAATAIRLIALGCGLWHLGRADTAAADTLVVGGVSRTYVGVRARTAPAPLVIVLHGNTQSGADMATQTSWPAVAAREGFSVLFPDGLYTAWADLRAPTETSGRHAPPGTDDVAFLEALVAASVADGSADAARIYITGVSNGGAMTLSMACLRADLFAAAATVNMAMTDGLATRCPAGRPLPMLVMTGTRDPLIPFEGGRGTSRLAANGFWSTARTVQFWRTRNGCRAEDGATRVLPHRDRDDATTVTRIASNCPAGQPVVLYRIDGGGHRMPSHTTDARIPRVVAALLGPQNHDIDGAAEIWAFFKPFARH